MKKCAWRPLILAVFVLLIGGLFGYWLGCTRTAAKALPDALSNEQTECIGQHSTITVNGVSLFYEVAGEGKPVILVHGNGGSHTQLHEQIRELVQAGYRVYAPDSRGQGENAPLDEYHYADMCEDMYQFITALGLEKPAYYGWSDGGIIGLLLESTHPGTLSVMGISGTNLSPDGAADEVIAWIQEDYEKTGSPLEKLMLTEPDIDPAQLQAIQIPVLVMAGSNDVIKPTHTQLIAERIPNSVLHIIDGEDHGSYIENSKIAGNLFIEFLAINGYKSDR